MKKGESTGEDDLRPEYRREDLGKGARGKYYRPHNLQHLKDTKDSGDSKGRDTRAR